MSSISHECTKATCFFCQEMKRLEELRLNGVKETKLMYLSKKHNSDYGSKYYQLIRKHKLLTT